MSIVTVAPHSCQTPNYHIVVTALVNYARMLEFLKPAVTDDKSMTAYAWKHCQGFITLQDGAHALTHCVEGQQHKLKFLSKSIREHKRTTAAQRNHVRRMIGDLLETATTTMFLRSTVLFLIGEVLKGKQVPVLETIKEELTNLSLWAKDEVTEFLGWGLTENLEDESGDMGIDSLLKSVGSAKKPTSKPD